MRGFLASLLSIVCLSYLCTAAFTNSYVVTMDSDYSPEYMFYSNDALFVVYQAYFWGSQPILSKIDPTSGDILYNLTIPFTRCYPCNPLANGLQVNDNFAVITVENGTLWELFTIDTVAAEPVVLASYIPSAGGFVQNLLPNGQNSILLLRSLALFTTTTHLVTYDATGTTITVTPLQTPQVAGVEQVYSGAVNLTPNTGLLCAALTEISPPYDNFISFETNTAKIEAAVNYGWGYLCPYASISTKLQGMCLYYSFSTPPEQQLMCWNYTLYSSLIPATQAASYVAPGAAYDGVVDDSGNFIGCYTVGSAGYLTQLVVNYNQSSYSVLTTAALKDNYYCVGAPSSMFRPIMNYRISSTLQQVAQLVTNFSETKVLLVNYDSTSTSTVKKLF